LTLVPAIRRLLVLQRLHSWNWFVQPSLTLIQGLSWNCEAVKHLFSI
jgi:hypothetical protein